MVRARDSARARTLSGIAGMVRPRAKRRFMAPSRFDLRKFIMLLFPSEVDERLPSIRFDLGGAERRHRIEKWLDS